MKSTVVRHGHVLTTTATSDDTVRHLQGRGVTDYFIAAVLMGRAQTRQNSFRAISIELFEAKGASYIDAIDVNFSRTVQESKRKCTLV